MAASAADLRRLSGRTCDRLAAGRATVQGLDQFLSGTRTVGVLRFPAVAELGHCQRLAGRDEDRVEPEAGAAAGRRRDRALERPAPAELASVGRDRDELADVT